MTEKAAEKCAIVVSDDLEIGLAINAASVISVTLGHRVEGLVGPDVKDADGAVHAGIIYIPVPVLRADKSTISEIVRTCASDDSIFSVNFSGLAQGCKTYDEYIGKMAATPTAELDPAAVGLHGPRKTVNKLVGSLPLMR